MATPMVPSVYTTDFAPGFDTESLGRGGVIVTCATTISQGQLRGTEGGVLEG